MHNTGQKFFDSNATVQENVPVAHCDRQGERRGDGRGGSGAAAGGSFVNEQFE
jgi:hypothetical protein